jgi:hypothetical protein
MQEQDPPFKGRAFFKGRDSSWGIFYPTGYIIAIFDSAETARRARDTLLAAGFTDDEVDAVPCEYVVADIEEGTRNATLLNRVKQQISKAFGTEAAFWEEDLKFARQGAGFLAIQATSDAEARRVLRLLQEKPKKMRRYGPLTIEELVK